MVESEKIHECPFCHGSSITKLQNDKYEDMYFCENCEHRFRYDPLVNNTIKEVPMEMFN